MRQSNQVSIAAELLQQMLAQGGTRIMRVSPGPPPDARIVEAWFDGEEVILVYDRPIEEPVFTHEADLERRLADLEAEVESIGVLLRDGGSFFEDRSGAGYVEAESIPRIAALLRASRS